MMAIPLEKDPSASDMLSSLNYSHLCLCLEVGVFWRKMIKHNPIFIFISRVICYNGSSCSEMRDFMNDISMQDSSALAQDLIEEVVTNPNIFVKWWNSIAWEEIVGLFISKGITLLFLLLIFFALQRLSSYVLHRTFEKQILTKHITQNRATTIYKMYVSIFSMQSSETLRVLPI
jgi:hypothetical protein